MSEYNFTMAPGDPPVLNFNYECCAAEYGEVLSESTLPAGVGTMALSHQVEGATVGLEKLAVEITLPEGTTIEEITLNTPGMFPVGTTVVLRGMRG